MKRGHIQGGQKGTPIQVIFQESRDIQKLASVLEYSCPQSDGSMQKILISHFYWQTFVQLLLIGIYIRMGLSHSKVSYYTSVKRSG